MRWHYDNANSVFYIFCQRQQRRDVEICPSLWYRSSLSWAVDIVIDGMFSHFHRRFACRPSITGVRVHCAHAAINTVHNGCVCVCRRRRCCILSSLSTKSISKINYAISPRKLLFTNKNSVLL